MRSPATRPASTAASAEAPLGSATSLQRSNSKPHRVAHLVVARPRTRDRLDQRRRSTAHVRTPGVASSCPSQMLRPTSTDHPLPRCQRAGDVGGRSRLDADHARRRGEPLRDSDDPLRPAHRPAHGTTTASRSSSCLRQLQPARPRAGHDPRVVVGMDQRRAALGGDPQRHAVAVVGPPVELDDLRAVALGGRPLARGRVARHEDRRVRARTAPLRGRGAWAWLPDDDVTTPRASSSSLSCETAL